MLGTFFFVIILTLSMVVSVRVSQSVIRVSRKLDLIAKAQYSIRDVRQKEYGNKTYLFDDKAKKTCSRESSGKSRNNEIGIYSPSQARSRIDPRLLCHVNICHRSSSWASANENWRILFIGHITLFGTCLHADARFLQLCNFSLLQGEASTSLSQIRFHSEVTVMAVIRLFFAGRAVDPVFMSRISLLKYHTMMSGKSWKSSFSVRTWTRWWWWRNVWFVVIFVRMIMMVLIMMVLIDRDYQHSAATCTAIHFNHQNITSRGVWW